MMGRDVTEAFASIRNNKVHQTLISFVLQRVTERWKKNRFWLLVCVGIIRSLLFSLSLFSPYLEFLVIINFFFVFGVKKKQRLSYCSFRSHAYRRITKGFSKFALVFRSFPGRNRNPLNRGAAENRERSRVAASILAPQPMSCPASISMSNNLAQCKFCFVCFFVFVEKN